MTHIIAQSRMHLLGASLHVKSLCQNYPTAISENSYNKIRTVLQKILLLFTFVFTARRMDYADIDKKNR